MGPSRRLDEHIVSQGHHYPAKLAWAYANAGQPADACRLAEETLDAVEQIDSQSARSELRRTVRVLDQWYGCSDVQDLTHRLGSRTLTT